MLREGEEAFFLVLFNDDIWTNIKNWIRHYYGRKKTSNFYNYSNGDIAAERGYFDLIKVRHQLHLEGKYNNLQFTTAAMDSTAGEGHLDIVQWLHHNRTEGCTIAAMDNAAGEGHLDIVQWLHHNRTEGCTIVAIDNAAYEDLEIVMWLYHNVSKNYSSKAIDGAVCHNIDLLKLLYDNGNEEQRNFTVDAFINILENDVEEDKRIEIVKFLLDAQRDHYIQNMTIAVDIACSKGYLDIVKLFYSEHSRCSVYGMDCAAAHNHFKVVKFLHRNSAECSYQAIDCAMMNGLLPIVKFLYINQRISYTKKGLEGALNKGHLNIIKWLRKHTKDRDKKRIKAFIEKHRSRF